MEGFDLSSPTNIINRGEFEKFENITRDVEFA